MARRTKAYGPRVRLQLGAYILAAARSLDTRAVKARLGRFARAHQDYVSAQEAVEAAEARVRAARNGAAHVDAIAGDKIERLAGALIVDGRPRTNPFAAYGAPAPRTLATLPYAEEARAAHELVAAIQRAQGVSTLVRGAAQAVHDAERRLEEAAAPIAKLQATLRDARSTRDALGPGWNTALASLRHDVLAAVGEGAPYLYEALFPAIIRTTRKRADDDRVGSVNRADAAGGGVIAIHGPSTPPRDGRLRIDRDGVSPLPGTQGGHRIAGEWRRRPDDRHLRTVRREEPEAARALMGPAGRNHAPGDGGNLPGLAAQAAEPRG